MRETFKKYRLFAASCAVTLLTLAFRLQTGLSSIEFTKQNLIVFCVTLTPIFVLIGLMDVWISRETMVRIMGERSGLPGTLLSFLFGTVTAVPLYALLPVAGMLLKKGSRIFNVMVFLGASSSLRIPLLLFEASSLGWKFTLVRFTANIAAVFAIAFIADRLLSEADKAGVYEAAYKDS